MATGTFEPARHIAQNSKTALLVLVGFLIVPLVLGCLLAPWIFHSLQSLEGHRVLGRLAEDRFERVATRTVQILALLLIWPALRISGTLVRVAPMLRWNSDRAKTFLRAFVAGAISMAAVCAAGFAVGNYQWRADLPRIVTLSLALLPAALLVGALEECLFRGFFFGVLRTRFNLAVAAIASSAFFSAIHFMRPRFPAPPETIRWSSGFELLPHMFTLFRPAYDWDFALTLFLMGIALCLILEQQGHLYGIAGLHAGWVWPLMLCKEVVLQRPRRHDFWFGWGENPAQGALVTMLAAGFAIGALITYLRRRDCIRKIDSATTTA